MPVVLIPAAGIGDRESFHDVFAERLGFPDYYGRIEAAWIDFVEPGRPRRRRRLRGEPPQIDDVDDLSERCPEQFGFLSNAVAFVNWRRLELGKRAIVTLSYARKGV